MFVKLLFYRLSFCFLFLFPCWWCFVICFYFLLLCLLAFAYVCWLLRFELLDLLIICVWFIVERDWWFCSLVMIISLLLGFFGLFGCLFCVVISLLTYAVSCLLVLTLRCVCVWLGDLPVFGWMVCLGWFLVLVSLACVWGVVLLLLRCFLLLFVLVFLLTCFVDVLFYFGCIVVPSTFYSYCLRLLCF